MKSFFSLLLIAASIGVFVMFIKPRYDSLQTLRTSVSAAHANLETAAKLTESREALIASYNSISKNDLDNIQTLLPDAVNNIRLIIQINSLATKNGLSLLRNVDYQTEQSTPPSTSADAARPYGEFVISFQTAGQYQNFLAFLADLEKNLRLVDVTKVEFVTNESPTVQNPASSMLYKITLKTYWLKQ